MSTNGRRIARSLRRSLAGLLVLALVVAGVAAYRLDLVEPWYDHFFGDEPTAPLAESPAEIPPPPGLDLPAVPTAAPVAAALAVPGRAAPAKVEAALAPYLADADLGPHVLAAVDDLTTGRPLARVGSGAAIPASTTKLLTGLAALQALGPERTFSTRVVAGGRGRIVLVGGGDPFLMSEPVDEDGPSYPPRADIVTLAQQTAAALQQEGRARVRLGFDDSLFAEPGFNPAWPAAYAEEGDIVSPITALWVDQGRLPESSVRVEDPSLHAAQVFAAALVEAGVKVVGDPTYGVAASGGREIATVTSAPVRQIVERVLEVSDNEASEVLAHHVGLAVGGTGSFEAGVDGTLTTLEALGVPRSGIQIYDGSGLSRENRITPDALLAVLRAAATGGPSLRTVIEGLPVAGFTGSLTDRFAGALPEARGLVRAKTGTLTAVSSLAGVVVDQQGHQMVFVLMADRIRKPRETAAENAIDDAAAALAACSCGRVSP
ncbi:D-alanyl-D-alanine carboxypeptidase/D-alanyl-D-alanine-endopeptidase [Nocardioides sp.]|uniref:D-alanyl-D-alanine carboxypeptidase/D-alanyl-D-alanine endopeptidase n=1 Tax=Nocardioides sp. TaxID=35761 RepID=UPI001A29E25C|nr:D-alanyl-D-alanine carboxypeptidase/D-alanyl-D-alanine-endopeptidase [Nocardioides sp.]MBJ7358974.1 D-alanyl-D-alanine carboxypeptidase/D-alanyl-D-alanine-endopeptidase [Nocardioides sp.]